MAASKYILIMLFFISGFSHQLMYFAFPVLALISLFGTDFKIDRKDVAMTYFLFFVLLAGLTLMQSIHSTSFHLFAIKGLFRYFAYFSLAIFMASMSAEEIKSFLTYVSYIFLLLCPLAIVQTIQQGRYQLLFEHPNHLAYVLVLLIYFVLSEPLKHKIWLVLGLSFSLFLTKSSGGLLTLVLIVLHYFYSQKQFSFLSKMMLSMVAMLMIAAVIYLFPERMEEQYEGFRQIDFQTLINRAVHLKFGSHGSGVWRVTYWVAILNDFFKMDLVTILLGTGLDSLTKGNYIFLYMTKDPHNDFVKILVEIGVLGVCAFFIFCYRLYKICRNAFVIYLLIIPMIFGNILVSFPYNMIYISLLIYLYKRNNSETVYDVPITSEPIASLL